MPSIILQSATGAAITALLAEHGLTAAGEGIGLAPGVAYSFIGPAAIPSTPPVALTGVYGLLDINPAVFGEAEMQSAFLALEPHRYTGATFAPLREVFGGSTFDPTAQVPFAVTMRQARLALLGANKLAAITAAMEALPEPTRSAAKITWEYSTEVQRYNGLVAQMAPLLGMTEAQIDELFIAARGL